MTRPSAFERPKCLDLAHRAAVTIGLVQYNMQEGIILQTQGQIAKVLWLSYVQLIEHLLYKMRIGLGRFRFRLVANNSLFYIEISFKLRDEQGPKSAIMGDRPASTLIGKTIEDTRGFEPAEVISVNE
jgi:hypothetical protein